MKQVSIIIPCYNEEDSLPLLFAKLIELEKILAPNFQPHFIFVDDGSKDKTYEILTSQKANLNSAEVIKHNENKNLGGALKTGISQSPKCDYVAFLDSDCTYEPDLLHLLLENLEQGADLSTVSPYHPLGQVEGVPEWRLALSKGLSILYRIILRTDFYTYTAMVRAVRQDKIHTLLGKSNDFSFVAEMFINAIKLNYHIVEVPAVLKVRQFGVSKMNILKTIRSHLKILSQLLRGKDL